MHVAAAIVGCLIVSVCYAEGDGPSPTPAPAPESVSTPNTPSQAPQQPSKAPDQALGAAANSTSALQPITVFDDRNLLAKGYRVKVIHGERYYCRREEMLGTRLQGALQCTSAEELRRREERSIEATQETQKNFSKMPDGGKP
jgi:hypothetical protein